MHAELGTAGRLLAGLVAAGCLAPVWVSAANGPDGTGDRDSLPLYMNNPGSIVERLKEDDASSDEYLFRVPGLSDAMQRWRDGEAALFEEHGLRFGASFTTLYQKASDTLGPEDDAASFDLDVSGSWTFQGRGTDSPTELGFNFFWRDEIDSEITPQTLFAQTGALYSSAAPYGEENPVVGELWIQKKFDNKYGFRVGKIFPITAYDFFPFKNFRTDFLDFNHVTNATIPLPGNGLGAFGVYRPRPDVMLRLGVHDANADVQKSGFDTYDGELFSIFEVGFDTGLVPRMPGRPPAGHVHMSLWHQEEREDAGIDDGWGVGLSAVQRFGRYTPFVRYGYADVDVGGPTSVEHMVNVGLVVDAVFGRVNDRFGFGYTWSDPVDGSLDEQGTLDAFYRVQLTPEIQFGPTLEVVFDPVRNPDENTIYIWGVRTRIAL